MLPPKRCRIRRSLRASRLKFFAATRTWTLQSSTRCLSARSFGDIGIATLAALLLAALRCCLLSLWVACVALGRLSQERRLMSERYGRGWQVMSERHAQNTDGMEEDGRSYASSRPPGPARWP